MRMSERLRSVALELATIAEIGPPEINELALAKIAAAILRVADQVSIGECQNEALTMDDQVKQPNVVNCKQCGHSWVGFYLPMPINEAARVMKSLTCPKCAAGTKHIMVFDSNASSANEQRSSTGD